MLAPAAPSALTTRLNLALYGVVLTAVAGFAYTDGNPTGLILLLPTILLAWVLVDRPQRHARIAGGVPKIVLNLIVLSAACYLWYEVVSDEARQALIVSLIHFIFVLTLCKLMEHKAPRDIAQIIVLSLLMVVANAMYSSSGMFYSLLLAIYFTLLFYVTMLLNVRLECTRAVRSSARPIDSPDRGGLLPFHRDLRNAVRHCFLLIVPLAVLVFLAMPRTRNPTLGTWRVGNLQTGFTDVLETRDYGELARSDTPVMSFWLTRGRDGRGVPIRVTGEFNDFYFRGLVREEFDLEDKNWGPPTQTDSLENQLAPGTATADAPGRPATAPARSDALLQHFILEPVGARPDSRDSRATYLFCLAPVSGPVRVPFHYYPQEMTLKYDGARPPGRISYTLQWNPNAPPPHEPATQPPLTVSQEITDLARQIARDFLTPERTVRPEDARSVMILFENYLRNSYPYSLTIQRIDRTKDAYTDFLVNHKTTGGKCDYFASCMVLMCRAVGLNARLVEGYHSGDYNSVDNTLLIRQKHAHAWAEVFIQEEGWITSDPTPGSAESNAGTSFLGRWFDDLTTVLEHLWQSIFVSFDNDSRYAVVAWLSRQVDFLAVMVTLDFWKFFLAGLWGPLAAVGLTLTASWALRRWRKNPHLVPPVSLRAAFRTPRAHPQIAFLDSLLHLLQRPDAPRRPDQTPWEYLQPLFAKLGSASDDVQWLVQTAYGIRFGHVSPDPGLRDQIALALRRIRTAVNQVR
jgi:protein-glutamine gamma-glutamyltransferase